MFMTGRRPGVSVDSYEALVTAERSGVVTRAAQPRITADGARIDAFNVSLVWLYCSYALQKLHTRPRR